MKNLMYYAWALLLLCSCRKVDDFSPLNPSDTTQQVVTTAKVENLGHIFTGSNIAWKLHPQDPNNSPLFTYLPNQTSGYCMVMIDNGKVDGRTPLNAFKFVIVDFQSFSSKVVEIKTLEGATVTSSVGRVVKWIFGMDKNFYVCTEASAGGGGHLIRYNPNTQTATDLGKPFNTSGRSLDIYTLNTGSDGALYGGSFGSEGEVYTFRYDYTQFQVDATPLDNTSKYVSAISGDSRYTYAVCGKNNWYLYSRDRQSGEVRTLKCNIGPAISMTIASHSDAPYAQSQATHMKLSGFNCSPLPEYHRPATNRVEYVPYEITDTRVPRASWCNGDSKVAYLLNNGQTGYINVNGLIQDVYPSAGPAILAGNKVYVSNDKQGILGAYTPGVGFQKIGSSSVVINSLAAPPENSSDAGKIFMGGYPKGLILEYTPTNNWSLNISDLTSATPSGFGTSTSNPGQRAMFQNPDAAGVYGSMSLLGMAYTKNGYIAGAGNNDRITSSSGRELSLGNFKNGTVRNLYLPEFANYDFQSMCVSKDSNYTFVSGYPHAGNVGKIFKYDPVANQVIASWDLPLWADRNTMLYTFSSELLIGFCSDVIYLFDITSGQIIWKQSIGGGQRVHALAIGPDNSVYINHMYRSPLNFKIVKYNIDASDKTNIKSTMTSIAEFEDADRDERNKPTGLLVGNGLAQGSTELYITGLPSFYKVSL